MPYNPQTLLELWKEQAAILRKWGAAEQATVLEACIAEVEGDLQRRANRRVMLDEAVEITGFTRGHIRRLMKGPQPKLRNVGTDEMPAFMLNDLPRKPGYGIAENTIAEHGELPVNYEWQAARAALFGE